EAPAQAGNPHAAPPVEAGQPAGDGAFNPGAMPTPARQRPIAPPPPGTDDTAPPPPQLRDGGSPVFPEIRPQAGMLERLSSGFKSMMPGSSAETVASPAAVHPAGSQKLQPLPLSSTMPSTGPWHDGFANPVQLGPLRAELETEEQPEPAGEARRVVAWQQGQSAAAQGWGDQWQASPSSLGGRMEVPGPPSRSAEIEPWPFHPDRLAQRIGQPVPDADALRSDEGTAAVPSSLRPSDSASQHAPVMPAPRRHRTSSVPPLFPVH
ncbi:MAG: hypothetical protein KDA79_24655, partial [Planctomycetaceae bacterium]|nr:hypothetical protein [Planctomycetaceae bacterium]